MHQRQLKLESIGASETRSRLPLRTVCCGPITKGTSWNKGFDYSPSSLPCGWSQRGRKMAVSGAGTGQARKTRVPVQPDEVITEPDQPDEARRVPDHPGTESQPTVDEILYPVWFDSEKTKKDSIAKLEWGGWPKAQFQYGRPVGECETSSS